MLCIGIDASTTRTGIAVIRIDGSYVFSELISIPAKRIRDPLQRSGIISSRFASMIDIGYSGKLIAAVGIEEPIYIQNLSTTIKLSILWGMLYFVAKRCTDSIYKIPIADGKYALTENRKATKAQMIDAAKLQFGIDMDEHCADAMGIALATRIRYIEEGLVNAAGNN